MFLLVIGHMSLVTSPNVRIRTRHCAFVVRLRLGVDAPAGADRGTHRHAPAGKIFRIARTRNGQRRSDGICKLVVALGSSFGHELGILPRSPFSSCLPFPSM